MAVEMADAYTFVLFPFTITCDFGGHGAGVEVVDEVVGAGVVDVVVTGGTEDVDGAGVEAVDGAGGSLTGLEVGTGAGAGAATARGSRYHAAAKPSLPPGSRTRTHLPSFPIFVASSGSRSRSCVPAGTAITTFAILELSVLERIFKPHVTESITRA